MSQRPMFSNESANQPQTTLTPDQLLSWARDNTATMRLRIKRDLLPGGYQAARAPVRVD